MRENITTISQWKEKKVKHYGSKTTCNDCKTILTEMHEGCCNGFGCWGFRKTKHDCKLKVK